MLDGDGVARVHGAGLEHDAHDAGLAYPLALARQLGEQFAVHQVHLPQVRLGGISGDARTVLDGDAAVRVTGHALAVDHVALSNLDEDDHNDVVELAAAYREHFGFPLIICARETEHFDRVLKNGWSRMDNSPAAEKAFALIEVAKIANYRFSDLVADANPIAAARFSRFNELT